MATGVGIKGFLPAKEPTVFLKKYPYVQTDGRERGRRKGVTGDKLSGSGSGRPRVLVLGAGDARNDGGGAWCPPVEKPPRKRQGQAMKSWT